MEATTQTTPGNPVTIVLRSEDNNRTNTESEWRHIRSLVYLSLFGAVVVCIIIWLKKPPFFQKGNSALVEGDFHYTKLFWAFLLFTVVFLISPALGSLSGDISTLKKSFDSLIPMNAFRSNSSNAQRPAETTILN